MWLWIYEHRVQIQAPFLTKWVILSKETALRVWSPTNWLSDNWLAYHTGILWNRNVVLFTDALFKPAKWCVSYKVGHCNYSYYHYILSLSIAPNICLLTGFSFSTVQGSHNLNNPLTLVVPPGEAHQWFHWTIFIYIWYYPGQNLTAIYP